MTLHYEHVENGRLDYEPDVYGDDTTQIFGDDATCTTIGLRELFFDARLQPAKRVFCMGALATFGTFVMVVMFFLIGGYIHVRRDIAEKVELTRNGLQVLPTPLTEGEVTIYIGSTPEERKKRADEIKDFIDDYEETQRSRSKFMTECRDESKPEHKWCRFNINKTMQRAGRGCSYDDNRYGYDVDEPCILITFRDHVDWVPKFFRNGSTQYLPFECRAIHRILYTGEVLNLTHYPVLPNDARYGGFALNKIPSRIILSAETNQEVSEEDGTTIRDLPPLAFVKLYLPKGVKRVLVHCWIEDAVKDAEFSNLREFNGIHNFRFEVATGSKPKSTKQNRKY